MNSNEVKEFLDKHWGDAKGYYIKHLSDFYCGVVQRSTPKSKKKRDMYKVGLGFDAKQMLKDNVKGIPQNSKDMKIVPLLLFIDKEGEVS